jgi:hypothetical protein
MSNSYLTEPKKGEIYDAPANLRLLLLNMDILPLKKHISFSHNFIN